MNPNVKLNLFPIMKTIVKIKDFGLTKLNNAEYTNFSTRVLSLVKQAGTLEPDGGSALGIEEEVLDEDESLLAMMNDIVAQSRISDLTAVLADLDRQRDDLVVYLFKLLRSKKASPVAAERNAAVSLYNLLKPYVGCQNLPTQQETVQIRGLLTDARKAENLPNVEALALANILTELESANDEYASLTEQRTEERAANRLDESKTVRARMDELYDYISTVAFVQSVASPTDATAAFVTNLNALIDETNALYNQRIAQAKRKTDPEA